MENDIIIWHGREPIRLYLYNLYTIALQSMRFPFLVVYCKHIRLDKLNYIRMDNGEVIEDFDEGMEEACTRLHDKINRYSNELGLGQHYYIPTLKKFQRFAQKYNCTPHIVSYEDYPE